MEPCDTGRLRTCGKEQLCLLLALVKHGRCLSFAGVYECLVCIQFLPPAVPFTWKKVSGKKKNSRMVSHQFNHFPHHIGILEISPFLERLGKEIFS